MVRYDGTHIRKIRRIGGPHLERLGGSPDQSSRKDNPVSTARAGYPPECMALPGPYFSFFEFRERLLCRVLHETCYYTKRRLHDP